MSQLADLSETETDWLARHLGHDIRVHRDYYRLQTSTITLAKVSKMLLAMDSGVQNRWTKLILAQIDLDDIPEAALGSDSEENEDNSGDDVNFDELVATTQRHSTIPSDPDCGLVSTTDDAMPATDSTIVATKAGRKKRPASKAVPWTAAEKSAVFKSLDKYIKAGKLPGKTACEQCINESSPVLYNRKWRSIKYFIKNFLTKSKKGMK